VEEMINDLLTEIAYGTVGPGTLNPPPHLARQLNHPTAWRAARRRRVAGSRSAGHHQRSAAGPRTPRVARQLLRLPRCTCALASRQHVRGEAHRACVRACARGAHSPHPVVAAQASSRQAAQGSIACTVH
jgi:hypothetical protein